MQTITLKDFRDARPPHIVRDIPALPHAIREWLLGLDSEDRLDLYYALETSLGLFPCVVLDAAELLAQTQRRLRDLGETPELTLAQAEAACASVADDTSVWPPVIRDARYRAVAVLRLMLDAGKTGG